MTAVQPITPEDAGGGPDVVRPGYRRVDARGTFLEVLNVGRWESLLCGEMRTGAVMGNHYHERTEVFFFLMRGAAEVTCIDVQSGARRTHRLNAQEGMWLRPSIAHTIRYEEPSAFIMLKSFRYDPDAPDTVPFPVL